MRSLIIVFTLLTLILLTIIFVGSRELFKENELRQSEIEGLRKQNKKERDSLQTQLALTRDSLSVAFNTIRIATAEREASHLRTQKTIRDLQRIVFIAHTDSSRTIELKNLYPTFNP